MSGIGPATVASWGDFERNPAVMHNLFSLDPNTRGLIYEPDKVSFLVGNNKGDRVFRVETAADLKAVEHRLLEKPMLLRCQLSLTKGMELIVVHCSTTWRRDVAVLLNPMSPDIREQMKQKFDEAMNLLCQGKQFNLEFDLSDALKTWFSDVLQNEGNPCSMYERVRCTNGTRVAITNHTPYNHFFDCNLIWCVLCLPCWFVSAPCYKCHRRSAFNDTFFHIHVPIVYRTPNGHHQVAQIANETTPLTVNNRSSVTAQPSSVAAPVADIRYVDQNAIPRP